MTSNELKTTSNENNKKAKSRNFKGVSIEINEH